MINEHQYAVQFLHENGNKIFVNGKQILVYKGYPKYNSSPLNPHITMGEDFLDENELDKINVISTQKLMEMGYCICSKKATEKTRWRTFQRNIFYIGKITNTAIPCFPKEIIIEHDIKNQRIRARGDYVGNPNGQIGVGGVTSWIYLNKESRDKQLMKSFDNIADYHRAIWRGDVDSYLKKGNQKIFLKDKKDLPIMYLEDNNLLCIPYEEDMQKMLFCGASGSGKSLSTNSIQSRLFWIWGDKVIWINDVLNQFHSLNLPSPYPMKLRRLKEYPRPMPTINLYSACPEVKFNHMDIDFLNVISFYEFLSEYHNYQNGISEWDLGGSLKYINSIKNELSKARDINEFIRIFEDAVNIKKGDTKEAVVSKIREIFISIFEEKFLDTQYNDKTINHKWTLKRKDGSEYTDIPLLVCTEAGLVPILNNTFARNKKYLKNYLAMIYVKIMNHQILKKFNKEKDYRLWVIGDEIKHILGKRRELIYNKFNELCKEGRFSNTGVLMNTQEYFDFSEAMRNNASHLFCGLIEDSKERNYIKKVYQLGDRANELANLKIDKQEIACCTKRKMIIYETNGKRREVRERFYRGFMLPPLTKHLSASEV